MAARKQAQIPRRHRPGIREYAESADRAVPRRKYREANRQNMKHYHLAQINVGRMVAPVDSPRMAGFVALLDPVNREAEQAPGYVWRLQTPAGNATGVQAFDDPRILVNYSIW